jgi:alkylation response protein AidB-like acyl-CoA dehydrogenase
MSDIDLYREAFAAVLRGPTPADVGDALVESGWRELNAAEPRTAVGVLFEEQGRAAAATPALDLLLQTVFSLETDTAIVHATSAAPSADGLLLAGTERAEQLLLPERDGALLAPASAVDARAVHGLDPSFGARAVRVDTGARIGAPTFEGVATVARRALAHELVGVGRQMLDVAVTQVSERMQFGHPVGAFQSVQHRLAEVRVALDAASAVLDAAWRDDGSWTACVAKAQAGRAALLAARSCQQVCGAIGFTEEHPLPALVRRASVLDVLYGSTTGFTATVGAELLDTRQVPRLPTPW